MVKDKITLNVLADISKRIGSTTIITPNSPSRVKSSDRALVVFNGSNIDIGDKLKEIKMLKDEGVSISIAFSFMGDKIVEEEKIISYLRPDNVYKEQDILELKSIANRYSYVVAPTLTISTMSKVVGGFIDNFLTNVIWTFLYMGKDVYIDFTSTQNYLGEPCKNQAIERLIGKRISAIKDLGAIEIKSGNYLNTILKKASHKSNTNIDLDSIFASVDKISKSAPIKKQSGKKILTGRDIEELARDNNSITLQKGSIITPLAKDKIRDLGISVNYL
jgi:hypothetical protein